MPRDKFSRKERLILMKGFFGLGLSVFLGLLFFSGAYSADFPNRSIQIVVPVQPGGPADTTARILSKRLTDHLKQPVVVVNKPGGGYAIGAQAVLTAPPDGHTIMNIELGIVMLPLIVKGVSFTVKDFTTVNLATSAPLSVIVKKEAPWRSLEELIADAKKNPDKITFSSAGPGSVARFAGELFQMNTGTKLTHVPMNGAAAAVTAVLGGQVDMSFMGFQVIKSHLEAGSLRGLAVLSPNRLKDSPNIPTATEKGYPNLTATVWIGHFVSAKTPQPVVARLGEVFNEVLKEKEIIANLERTGLLIENMGPEEAAKFVAAEQKKWSEVAKAANIVPK